MIKTVVGSYPPLPQDPSSFLDQISSFFGSYDKYKPAIALAVQDQIEAGIDIISDGQVRANMIEIFARAIPGMMVEDKTPKIMGKIIPPINSIGAGDLKFAMKVAEGISEDYSKNSNKMLKDGVKGIKGIITGPSTLVFSCRIEGFYNKKEEAIIDLAKALKREAEYLENAGAMIIQVDEPFISTGMVDISAAKRALKIITKDLCIPISLHVCGEVTNIWDKLLRFDAQILDFEFAGIRENLTALENMNLRAKKIGFGCIDTKTDKTESKEEVMNLIKKGMDFIGRENMIIDPDCGMRMRSRKAAFSKLKVMVEAANTL